VISGTPSTAGNYSFTAQVTDSATPAQTDTQPLDITINNPPPLTITSFSPTSGKKGTEVTITGTGFIGVTKVTFKGKSASSFTVDSDTQIRAVVPLNTRTGPIGVTNAAGSALSSSNFTVTK